jgi:hypothetical protein
VIRALLLVLLTATFAATAVAATPKGSRTNPYRLHTLVKLPEGEGWKLRVNKSVPNATRVVLAENQFNDRPKAGRQFFMINITLVYTGKGSASAFAAVDLSVVGRSNVAYEGLDDDCGVIPDELDDFKKVFSGGRITGNICFSVRKSDVSSLLLFYEPSFSLRDTQVFFRVR